MRIRSLAKHALALPALTLGLLLVLSGPAAAEETWAVRSGRTTIHFNTPLLRDLGVEVTDVAGTLPRPVDLWIEGPNWTFPIDESSDLGFRTLAGVVVPGGITGGAIRHGGEFAIVSTQNGARTEFKAPRSPTWIPRSTRATSRSTLRSFSAPAGTRARSLTNCMTPCSDSIAIPACLGFTT